jgi:DNA-binding transcriptional LysR family regulator
MSINFELLDLRAFIAVYDHRSFREAADLLHLSQPALSRRVQALEKRLRVPLFERSTRHVLPTAVGLRFEPMARRLLEELDVSLNSIGAGGDQQSGQLTIASLPSAAAYFLPRVMDKFSTRFPLVRLRVLERLVVECLQCVIRGEAEFGINVHVPTEIDVTFLQLLDDPYVFVCNRRHPLARKKSIVWQDLSGHSLIGIGRAVDSGNRALLDDVLRKVNIQLNWRYEVNNFTTALRLIEENLGAAVMPSMGSTRTRNLGITTVPLSPLNLTRSIGIIERRRGRLSTPAKHLKDILIAETLRGLQPSTRSLRKRNPADSYREFDLT